MNWYDASALESAELDNIPEPGAQVQHVRWRVDLRLLIAILSAIAYHGTLSISGTYRSTYDAYVHIFFADHWRRTWFDHWDPRWYTGFTLTSYPPLSQQSVALLSNLTDDLELAFAIVQTSSMVVMTIGMYRFAQLWVDRESAGWAALWLVFSSAMAETVHVFGQLPTTFSLGLLLNALPFTYGWIVEGRPSQLAKSWALTAATTGAHHVTTLFGSVFITAPVIVLALVHHLRLPLPDEPEQHPEFVTRQNLRALVFRRLRRMMPAIVRSGVFGVGTICLLILVVFPYWAWSRSDPITQVPIPHASRDNYLENLNSGLVFWLIPYGMLLFTFPYVFYKGYTTKSWPLISSISLLALLGTGGTTPIPRMLLQGAFDILTLDRFTLWASILMLPLAGQFMGSLLYGNLARWFRNQFGPLTQRAVCVWMLGGLLFATIMVVNLTQFRRFQPASIDMQPIVTFLHKDEHWRWRYMTLGFGDQMAWLSAQTTAVQVDGNYHSARRLPELTTTPVERLEGAKFRGIPGIGSLQQFLAVPDKYNLKYIFSNDQFYDPLLYFYGWNRIQRLENHIVVWAREDIPVLPEVLPRKEIPLYHRIMFGILPVGALVTVTIVLSARYWSLPFRLLSEILGLKIQARFTSRLYALVRPIVNKWQQLDHWLLDASQLPSGYDEEADRVDWQLRIKRWIDRISTPPSVTARQARLWTLVVILLSFGISIVWKANQVYTDPERIIWSYYDDLDFRRFESAYERLNPQERPTFDEYMLNLSVSGGLVASYSKLESLNTTMTYESGDVRTYEVATKYITALSYYTDTVELTLTNDPNAGWVISPDEADIKTPPDQFLRRPSIDWLSQERRSVTSGTTSFTDVLDRPELEILSARLVRSMDGRYSVVGEVFNRDVDPADITVSAYLFDDEDELLTWYNAGAAMIHKQLPLEITPFRVDFEGVAGLPLDDESDDDSASGHGESQSESHGESDEETDGASDVEAHEDDHADELAPVQDGVADVDLSFSPDSDWFYKPESENEIDRFDVYAKAVVTKQDLYRGLGVQGVEIAKESDDYVVRGSLINSGLKEAVIPQMLLTFYDEDGKVVWVEDVFIRESVRAQRTLDFNIDLPSYSDFVVLESAGRHFTNSLSDYQSLVGPRSDFIPMPVDSGFRYMRISVHAFLGGSG